MRRILRASPVDLLIGVVPFVTGAFVSSVWLLQLDAVARHMPVILAMQFNTALCFMLCGVGFVLSNHWNHRISQALAVVVAIVAGLTLVQYFGAVDLGIDTLLIEPFASVGASSPGRMAPNTACAFLLIAAAIGLRAADRAPTFQQFLGFLTAVIATIAINGYLINLDRAHDWVNLARMSPHTALCFLSLGLGLLARPPHASHKNLSLITAALAFVTYLALLTLTYMELRDQEDQLNLNLVLSGDHVRHTVSSLILISGVIYAGLILYAYWYSRQFRISAAALTASEARLAAVIDNAVEGIVTIDRKGIIQSVNRACERMFGYRSREMIGQNVKMLMPQHYSGQHDTYLKNYSRTGQARIIGIGRSVEGLRKDGSVFPLDLSVARIELADGVIYSGILRDISERQNLIREVAESSERLAAVIDNAADGILTVSATGIILSANAACERIFGYAAQELIGQEARLLRSLAYDAERTRQNRPNPDGLDLQKDAAGRVVEARRKDGTVFPLDVAIARIDLPSGPIYSSIVRDVSERKHFEDQLLAANAELEEFAYRTSHDLRSPIASSIGLLRIAKDMRASADTAALGDMLDRLDNNLQRLDKLVQNIMVLTRNRLMPEQDEEIAVRAMVEDALQSVAHLEGFADIRIDNRIDPGATLVTKPLKFQIIVANLISNAVKYSDFSQAQKPEIVITAAKQGDRFIFAVEDNGIGVPAKSRPMLFKMFKRLHPERAFGSGLGLYILLKSAEALGGTASYEPKIKGSRFAVELPAGRK
ncbi:PAS domain S-box-containing protein [Hoeflea marina]|uniref:Sensor protein FixL n=1 Tax=Hoeflea marina TaxID=274592 RepID=A0A317PRG8_9HYPH|nr:PAS domain S-box protein [Hoeflea marina]PWW02160.1 PAS domain S-box-containing protein [Hoeflea marina]